MILEFSFCFVLSVTGMFPAEFLQNVVFNIVSMFTLVRNHWTMCEFSVLFHWSMHLSFPWYYFIWQCLKLCRPILLYFLICFSYFISFAFPYKFFNHLIHGNIKKNLVEVLIVINWKENWKLLLSFPIFVQCLFTFI